MAQQTMYSAQTNSIQVELASSISNSVATIPVSNAAALPAAPNLATIGMDETAETILYTGKSGNDLTGVTRGFQGIAKAWSVGAKVARYFTAYDHDSFKVNVADHELRILSTENWFAGLGRQAIINGNFVVWQRGTSFNAGYTADRWLSVNFTGTASRQAFAVGQTAVPDNPKYFINLNATSANPFSRIEQRIEDVTTFAGKKITVSFWAKSSVSSPIAMVEVAQNFGIGGTALAIETPLASNIALTTTWQKFSYSITVPSISGKTVGTDSFIALVIAGAWGSAVTYNIDIAQVQVCAGDVALPFQPRSFADELQLCQRYYEKSYKHGSYPASSTLDQAVGVVLPARSANDITGYIPFKVNKRTDATVQIYSYNGTISKVSTTFAADVVGTGLTIVRPGESGFNGVNDSGNSFTAGTYYWFGWTADAEL